MRKHVCLLGLAIFGLLMVLGGCSPRIIYPSTGEVKSNQDFKTTIHNDGPFPIFYERPGRGINLWETLYAVFPRNSVVVTNKGGWETKGRIRFGSPGPDDFVGETITDIPFRYLSPFHREIRISHLTLNRRSLQLGRVWNKSNEAMDVYDNYGNRYVLQPGEFRLYEVPSGALQISYKPIELKQPHIRPENFNLIVNNKPDSHWHLDPSTGEYKPIGWYVDINYFPNIWR
ncbi:MAG: hypothetical protein PHO91_01275 [Patescibacteria group bacterium]|nr:hypothetical protein [Patescibacteria group bacterium]